MLLLTRELEEGCNQWIGKTDVPKTQDRRGGGLELTTVDKSQ